MPIKKMISATALCLCSAIVLAEPALQTGDTLESLSKVRISTTLQTPVSAEEAALVAELDMPEIEAEKAEIEVKPQQKAEMTSGSSDTADEQIIAELDSPELS